MTSRVALQGGGVLKPFAKLAWVHEFMPERNITASLVSIPGAGFAVEGARVTSNALQVSTGAKLDLGRGVGMFVSFDGEFSGQSQLYSGTGGLSVTW